MTRILTEKYQCGNCGADLFRSIVTSFSVFKSGPFSLNGLSQKAYLCDRCGYVGQDLSIPPSEEVRRILDSKEYHYFLDHTFRNDEPVFFLMGLLDYKLGRYLEAAYWLCRSLIDKDLFKMDKGLSDRIVDELTEKRDVDFELVCAYDEREGLSGCYIRELVFECALHCPFEKEADGPLFLHIVDALRSNGHFKEALEAVELREQVGDIAALLEKERLLSQEKNALEEVDIGTLI